jgi:hypothetical protein
MRELLFKMGDGPGSRSDPTLLSVIGVRCITGSWTLPRVNEVGSPSMRVLEQRVVAWESYPVLCVVVLLKVTISPESAGAQHIYKKPQLHTCLDVPRLLTGHTLGCLDVQVYLDVLGPDRFGRPLRAVVFEGDFAEIVRSLAK